MLVLVGAGLLVLGPGRRWADPPGAGTAVPRAPAPQPGLGLSGADGEPDTLSAGRSQVVLEAEETIDPGQDLDDQDLAATLIVTVVGDATRSLPPGQVELLGLSGTPSGLAPPGSATSLRTSLSLVPGSVEFTALAPGRWTLWHSAGGEQLLELRPAERSEIEIDLASIRTARVEVYSESGLPIPAASILHDGYIVAETDREGRATVWSDEVELEVAVVAPGFARGAGVLRNFLLDAPQVFHLEPDPSAQLRVEVSARTYVEGPGMLQVTCQRGRADEAPSFAIRHRTHRLRVHVDDLSEPVPVPGVELPCWVWVHCVSGDLAGRSVTWVEEPNALVGVPLEPRVSLRGRVVDQAGTPLQGAIVTQRPTDHGMFCPSAVTDAEGHFELGVVPSGVGELTTLTLGSGAVVHPIASLHTGDGVLLVHPLENAIFGTVRWMDGTPATGLFVATSSSDEFRSFDLGTGTGATGEYSLAGAPPEGVWLGVFSPGLDVRLGSRYVGPDEFGRIDLFVERRSATIALTIRPPEGTSVADASVLFRSEESGRTVELEPTGNGDEFAAAPGSGDLFLNHPALGCLHLGRVELRAGERHDLGAIAPEPPGSLAFQPPECPSGCDAFTLYLHAPESGTRLPLDRSIDGPAEFSLFPVQPGNCSIEVRCRHGSWQASAEVRSDTLTRCSLIAR